VDRFQDDPEVRIALCNIVAGGVGITLTAGAHVIFQDLDWVPANHAQAEDRCYRLGQKSSVTVEYFHAHGSLDGYIARLLETKIQLMAAVEAEEIPDASILAELEANLRRLSPALMEEARLAAPKAGAGDRISALVATAPAAAHTLEVLAETGTWAFKSSRDASRTYLVTFGRAGHLECTCEGFVYRGNCKHVIEVREKV
jgi:hypothetical protein